MATLTLNPDNTLTVTPTPNEIDSLTMIMDEWGLEELQSLITHWITNRGMAVQAVRLARIPQAVRQQLTDALKAAVKPIPKPPTKPTGTP